MTPTPETLRQCETCGSGGVVPIGEHFVSHEMASDAGEPSMEGMSMGIEWGPCPNCSGCGEIAALAQTKEEK